MVEGPVTNRRFKRRTVRNAIIGVSVFALIAAVGVVGWIVYSKMSTGAEQAAMAAKDEKARSVATEVRTKYAAITAQLKELAKDQATISLFESADTAALEAAANQKQSGFPHVLKLRYLLPGSYQLDTESNPPLSYASMDLLNKAEKTNQVNSEVLLFGSPKQHIVVIERVVNPALELVGLLHLSLNVDVFSELVEGIAPANTYIELAQRASGKNIVLAKAGDAGYRQGEAMTVSVDDTRWIIALWTADELLAPASSESSSLLPIIAVVLIGILLIGGGLLLLKKRGGGGSSKKGKISTVTYEGAVRAIVEGAHAGVKKWIPHLPEGDRITSNPKPLSQGMEGDDVTMIAKPKAPAKKAQAPADDITQVVPLSAEDETPQPKPKPKAIDIDPVIFRTYDIRGVVGETLTVEAVSEIAKALGTMASEKGQQTLVVGRDGRTTGQDLTDALIEGLRSTGRDVIDIGMVPTPVLYFATYHLETGSGVMVTGSHNPSEYNGLKMMLGGNTLSGDDIQEIKKRTETADYASGQGSLRNADINADYIRRISEDIPVALGASLKIVVDCGNGVAGVLAPQLLNAIGHDVIEIHCDIDGTFPNHHPDPSQPENMQDLIGKVKAENADVGFAFDGDGDRLGVVDAEGTIIWPDRQMMLLAKDVLSRNAGASIIYDVKCSRYLRTIIETFGGKPLMWKTGHSLIKSKMKEVEAPLAGEMSGHIFFKERWYGFDDALYTAARFIEIFTNAKQKPTEMFAELPDGVSTPELRMPLAEKDHGTFMAALIEKMHGSTDGEVFDIDGVRIEYKDGWGLARPSNTSPNIILRFEGENQAALERIQGIFKEAIHFVNADIKLPF